MVSIFQGLYKEKYNRCRHNYKLVDVEYKGEAATEEESCFLLQNILLSAAWGAKPRNLFYHPLSDLWKETQYNAALQYSLKKLD